MRKWCFILLFLSVVVVGCGGGKPGGGGGGGGVSGGVDGGGGSGGGVSGDGGGPGGTSGGGVVAGTPIEKPAAEGGGTSVEIPKSVAQPSGSPDLGMNQLLQSNFANLQQYFPNASQPLSQEEAPQFLQNLFQQNSNLQSSLDLNSNGSLDSEEILKWTDAIFSPSQAGDTQSLDEIKSDFSLNSFQVDPATLEQGLKDGSIPLPKLTQDQADQAAKNFDLAVKIFKGKRQSLDKNRDGKIDTKDYYRFVTPIYYQGISKNEIERAYEYWSYFVNLKHPDVKTKLWQTDQEPLEAIQPPKILNIGKRADGSLGVLVDFQKQLVLKKAGAEEAKAFYKNQTLLKKDVDWNSIPEIYLAQIASSAAKSPYFVAPNEGAIVVKYILFTIFPIEANLKVRIVTEGPSPLKNDVRLLTSSMLLSFGQNQLSFKNFMPQFLDLFIASARAEEGLLQTGYNMSTAAAGALVEEVDAPEVAELIAQWLMGVEGDEDSTAVAEIPLQEENLRKKGDFLETLAFQLEESRQQLKDNYNNFYQAAVECGSLTDKNCCKLDAWRQGLLELDKLGNSFDESVARFLMEEKSLLKNNEDRFQDILDARGDNLGTLRNYIILTMVGEAAIAAVSTISKVKEEGVKLFSKAGKAGLARELWDSVFTEASGYLLTQLLKSTLWSLDLLINGMEKAQNIRYNNDAYNAPAAIFAKMIQQTKTFKSLIKVYLDLLTGYKKGEPEKIEKVKDLSNFIADIGPGFLREIAASAYDIADNGLLRLQNDVAAEWSQRMNVAMWLKKIKNEREKLKKDIANWDAELAQIINKCNTGAQVSQSHDLQKTCAEKAQKQIQEARDNYFQKYYDLKDRIAEARRNQNKATNDYRDHSSKCQSLHNLFRIHADHYMYMLDLNPDADNTKVAKVEMDAIRQRLEEAGCHEDKPTPASNYEAATKNLEDLVANEKAQSETLSNERDAAIKRANEEKERCMEGRIARDCGPPLKMPQAPSLTADEKKSVHRTAIESTKPYASALEHVTKNLPGGDRQAGLDCRPEIFDCDSFGLRTCWSYFYDSTLSRSSLRHQEEAVCGFRIMPPDKGIGKDCERAQFSELGESMALYQIRLYKNPSDTAKHLSNYIQPLKKQSSSEVGEKFSTLCGVSTFLGESIANGAPSYRYELWRYVRKKTYGDCLKTPSNYHPAYPYFHYVTSFGNCILRVGSEYFPKSFEQQPTEAAARAAVSSFAAQIQSIGENIAGNPKLAEFCKPD